MRTNLPEAERQDGKLPAFASPEVAEHELFAKRDDSLRWLEGFVRRRGTELTYEPGALDSLERLYFELWGGGVASRVRGNRSSFESAMGVFWGAVAVAQKRATWTIYESPFAPNHFGLAVTRGGVTVVLNAFGTDWNRRPGNTRRNLLRRIYKKWFAAD